MNQTAKAKLAKGTLFLYASACAILAIGIASLYNHVSYFNTMVAQYVEQGYPQSEVLAQLMPSQFLPVVYQTISLNLGIALVLVAAAMIYQKTTASSMVATESTPIEESVVQSGEVSETETPSEKEDLEEASETLTEETAKEN